ncbi:Lrp/AsnC family transcriptional regulator [Kytococcus sedentarius]|uniref:Lrp/AsnC family transcriptional regulator n=1 Tax=Kytococcus sedentarius TaxID=1276 RepID=UPI0035BBAF6F
MGAAAGGTDGPGAASRTAVSEGDLALLHLLQIAPRATWADAARVLGSSPSTLAARWRRLCAERVAWATVQPHVDGDGVTSALVVARLDPARADDAIAGLVDDHHVVSVDTETDGTTVLCTVMARGLTRLHEVVAQVARRPGVVAVDTSVVVSVDRDGTAWRLGALDADERREAAALAVPPRSRRAVEGVGELAAALVVDARAPVAGLARDTGAHPSTVRRHLEALLAGGTVTPRCDMSHVDIGWPVTRTWFLRVPPAGAARVTGRLAGLGNLRLVASVTGDATMVVSAVFRSLTESRAWEQQVLGALPEVAVVRSVLLVSPRKRMGWVLDERGRRTDRLVLPAVLAPA